MMLAFRGNAYMSLKDYKSALPDYDSSLVYKENLKEDVDLNSGHTGVAMEERNASVNAIVASVEYSIAEINLNEGKYEKSLKAINEAIAVLPEMKGLNAELYYYLRGYVQLILERYPLAIKDFEKSIQINAAFAPAYVNRAVAKINMRTGWKPININLFGSTDKVMDAGFQLPVKLKGKENADVLQAGLSDCNKAIDLDPQLEQAFYIRGKIKFALQQPDYCYDLLKAKTLGVIIEPELMVNCGNK